jgi:hypothetical protein
MNAVPEFRREKVFIPSEMTTKEIKEEYRLPSEEHGLRERKDSS